MTARIESLERLKTSLVLGRDGFAREYPGVFFIAVGLVATDRLAADFDEGINLEDTLSMGFGERMVHAMRAHPLAGKAFFVPGTTDTPQTVGRRPGSDLTIPETSVSEQHCQIRLGPGGAPLTVTDLGSTNGTYVNLERLEPRVPTEVEEDAILTLGRYSFQYLSARALFNCLEILDQG